MEKICNHSGRKLAITFYAISNKYFNKDLRLTSGYVTVYQPLHLCSISSHILQCDTELLSSNVACSVISKMADICYKSIQKQFISQSWCWLLKDFFFFLNLLMTVYLFMLSLRLFLQTCSHTNLLQTTVNI